MLDGGKRRALNMDQFVEACDRVFEGQPSPPAPSASTLTDEFEVLAQGMVRAAGVAWLLLLSTSDACVVVSAELTLSAALRLRVSCRAGLASPSSHAGLRA